MSLVFEGKGKEKLLGSGCKRELADVSNSSYVPGLGDNRIRTVAAEAKTR